MLSRQPPERLPTLMRDWLRHGHKVLLTGTTASGKNWLPCALGQQAARLGFSVLYTP